MDINKVASPYVQCTNVPVYIATNHVPWGTQHSSTRHALYMHLSAASHIRVGSSTRIVLVPLSVAATSHVKALVLT